MAGFARPAIRQSYNTVPFRRSVFSSVSRFRKVSRFRRLSGDPVPCIASIIFLANGERKKRTTFMFFLFFFSSFLFFDSAMPPVPRTAPAATLPLPAWSPVSLCSLPLPDGRRGSFFFSLFLFLLLGALFVIRCAFLLFTFLFLDTKNHYTAAVVFPFGGVFNGLGRRFRSGLGVVDIAFHFSLSSFPVRTGDESARLPDIFPGSCPGLMSTFRGAFYVSLIGLP